MLNLSTSGQMQRKLSFTSKKRIFEYGSRFLRSMANLKKIVSTDTNKTLKNSNLLPNETDSFKRIQPRVKPPDIEIPETEPVVEENAKTLFNELVKKTPKMVNEGDFINETTAMSLDINSYVPGETKMKMKMTTKFHDDPTSVFSL